MSLSITAVGAYVPRARLPAEAVSDAWGRFNGAGIRSTAVLGADEDTLTMAAEAAHRALEAGDVNASALEAVTLATTTPPLEEEEVTVRLGAFLGTNPTTRYETRSASTNAGVAALADALEADVGPVLVVASDAPRGEPDSPEGHAAGAGAAAFLLVSAGSEAQGAEMVARADAGIDYPGTRFRKAGSGVVDSLGITPYEREAFSETIDTAANALESIDLSNADVVAVQAPNGKLPYRAASVLGIDTDVMTDHAVVHELGDLGAASVPLSLASAMATDEESIVGVGYGSGSAATIVALETGGGASSDGFVAGSVDFESEATISYAEALRLRDEITGGEPDGGGAYVSVPSWQRSTPQRYRLEAGECPACGALNFLPRGACRRCHNLVEYETVRLEREGTIETVSVISQGGAPPEFAELQARSGDYATAIVSFDGPGEERASAPLLVVDAEPDSVAVDDRVEATIRRIYTQEGVTRYGIKVRPLE
ncbi:zinc ribbon domain-containing protein [Natrialbaceae archaeon A-CW1-1]